MLCHRGAVKKSDVTLRELSLVLRTGEKPSRITFFVHDKLPVDFESHEIIVNQHL